MIRHAPSLTLFLFLSGLLPACGEKWQWEGDDADANGPRYAFALGPVFGIPGEPDGEPAPALKIAGIENPLVLGGSGSSAYVKITLECMKPLATEASCPASATVSHALSRLRAALTEDESGRLASKSLAFASAGALLDEAAKKKTVRDAKSFTILAAGKGGVENGGLLLTLPLGEDPKPGRRYVVVVEALTDAGARSSGQATAASYAWFPLDWKVQPK